MLFQDSPAYDIPVGQGYDLSGATKVTFQARTNKPGLKLKVLFGSPNSSCGEISKWSEPVGSEWKPFVLAIPSRRDLSKITAGFGIVWNDEKTPDSASGCDIFLDNIRIEFDDHTRERRRELPRFLQSYSPAAADTYSLANAAYVYDQAVAICAFLADGGATRLKRAEEIGRALIYSMDHDPSATDGRLRNADHACTVPQHPNAKDERAVLPGFYDQKTKMWCLDYFACSSSTGNLAWAGIAFLNLSIAPERRNGLQPHRGSATGS